MRFRQSDSTFQYDYFEKDHLGSVRLMLTEEAKTDAYPAATMETATAATEELLYSNLSTTRVTTLPSGYPADTPAGNAAVAKVNGSGNKIGPAIVLKVMAGDKFNLKVNSWYKKNGASPGSPGDPLTDLLSALTTSVGGVTSAHGGPTALELQSGTVFNTGAASFLSTQSPVSGKPKAFVNWVLFDEQFKFVASSSGAEVVGADDVYTPHCRTDMPIDKNGYLYIYVSNETPNIDVFFDNLQVTHVRGPILEETHYYPWGLVMAGISSKALSFGEPGNKKKYQGYESNHDFDLDTYEAFYRTHDPQIGRWWQIDPRPESSLAFSLYASMNNNPVSATDFLGDIVDYERGDGVTKKEYRQFKREIRQMKRNSGSFKAAFKDLKKSDKTFVYTALNHANGGRTVEPTASDNKYHINVGIHTTFPENKDEKMGRISTIAHETGHAWLKEEGKEVSFPVLSEMLNSGMSKADATFALNNYESKYEVKYNANELMASHFQNIVSSELMQSGNSSFQGLNLAEYYYGGLKSTMNPKTLLLERQEFNMPLLTPPKDKSYYLNTKFNIYDEF